MSQGSARRLDSPDSTVHNCEGWIEFPMPIDYARDPTVPPLRKDQAERLKVILDRFGR